MKVIDKLYLDVAALLILTFFNYRNFTPEPEFIIGLVLVLISLPFWVISRIQLGKSFSTLPEARKLIKTGVYSKIRNPIYLFSGIFLLGAILPSKSFLQYLFFVLVISIQLFRSYREEKILMEKFGNKYAEYKNRTWF
jgi:protein-S-isoprenylcysteine O-methyltransferase Ste14